MVPVIIYNENIKKKYTKELESKRELLIILDRFKPDPTKDWNE